MTSTETDSQETHTTISRRRRFLKEASALVAAGIALLAPCGIAMGYILSPLFRNGSKQEAGDGFRFVGKTGGLVPGGPPQLFQVIGVKKDAWTTHPGQALGSVFVSQRTDGSLLCLNARCTHLGCTVGFRPKQDEFFCPCHTASFTVTGERTNGVPPRNLDRLEAEIRNKDEIWVKFQNYRCGTDQQIPV